MNESSEDKSSELRKRAEEIAQAHTNIPNAKSEDIASIIHDLQVHQIELEMQNDELRQAQLQLEAAKARYSDLYDFAPVGYLTLEKSGLISDANLTSASMLACERTQLITKPFSQFVFREDQDTYYLHLRKLFETRLPQLWEVRLLGENGSPFYAQLDCAPVENHEGNVTQCRMIISDITKHKQTEEEAGRRVRLLAVTTALSQTLDLQQVARFIIDEGMTALGASAAAICLLADDENFEIVYAVGSPTSEHEREQWLRFAADPQLPVTNATQRREAIWLESHEERQKRYPAAQLFTLYPGAWAILPLLVGGRVLGAINFAFAEDRKFDVAERAFMVLLSYQCAQALERARLREQAQEVAVLQERQRIARELHDAVTQTLFSATIVAETLMREWERQPEKVLEYVQLVHKLTRGAGAELRSLLTELRPESIVNARLGDLLMQLADSMQMRLEINISLVIGVGNEQALPAAAQLVFYRIAQESLNNILKHGQATQARIRLTRSPTQVMLIITDNGQGFDVRRISAGLGLNNMRERAESISASLEVKSTPGRGTRVRLIWNVQGDSP